MHEQRSDLHDYQREFIALALRHDVLRFGQFTLKSGRQSPYFFNAGLFSTGSAVAGIGRAYAAALAASGQQFDMLFGPAYKGIPLVTATAAALAERHGLDLPFAFNRKETKSHGEGGALVGHALRGRVLIVDDVITAGTAIRESIAFIRAAGATPAGVLLALDREERGVGTTSAVDEVRASGLAVLAILTLSDLIRQLDADLAGVPPGSAAALRAYRAQYGTQPGRG